MTAVDDFITNLQQYRRTADSGPMIGDIDLFILALQQLSSGGSAFGIVASNEYTSNDTWTKSAGSKLVYVEVIAGGGGAGSGAAGIATTIGGDGGAAAAVSANFFRAIDLPASVSVTVGASAAGGVGVTGVSNGNPGIIGNPSSFGIILAASGGAGGAGGAAFGPTQSNPGSTLTYLTVNAGSSVFPGSNISNKGGLPFLLGGPGGGANGARIIAGLTFAGVLGGAGFNLTNGKGDFQQTSLTSGEGGGTVGAANDASAATPAGNVTTPNFGDGGASGGSSLGATNGGAGANGAAPGGGGGGGGASRDTGTSGAGGTGARGAVRVIEYGNV